MYVGSSTGAKGDPVARTAYDEVMDLCDVRDWTPLLIRARNKWSLEIRNDAKDLIIRVSTTVAAPDAFARLGQRSQAALRKAKLL